MGQNFLISQKVLKKIIAAAELKKSDLVLEIGPGTGILTKELASRSKRIVAVEKDKKLADLLKENLKGEKIKNVKIIHGDILKTDWPLIKKFKIVANIPYYITAPLIRKFLESNNPPLLMILTVQKEVAEKICSQPPDMSKLAVFTQLYAQPKIIARVSKSCFWPQPKVDSAVLKIIPKTIPSKFNLLRFEKIIKAGFSQPRKQLINNLSKHLNLPRQRVEKWLIQNKIKPSQRAETLSINEWLALSKSFKP